MQNESIIFKFSDVESNFVIGKYCSCPPTKKKYLD